MPLQNRVTPFGDIVALDGRGLLMGNRGVLHDSAGRIVRAWQTRRWIACRTEFRGRQRKILQPNRWTELFFLDEATALAAGHRPCAECRNADYRRFRVIWTNVHGEPESAENMDVKLHADRLDGKRKRTFERESAGIPDGTFVIFEGSAWLASGGGLYKWSNRGYTDRRRLPSNASLKVLTPSCVVDILAAGYRPLLHGSIE